MKRVDGLTYKAKNREKIKRREEKNQRRMNWHKWFAWYPVVIAEKDNHKIKIWLQYIWRKADYGLLQEDGYRYLWGWEYSELKPLKNQQK